MTAIGTRATPPTASAPSGAPPVGHGAVDPLEDDGEHHRGGQVADGHEALLDHVLESRGSG